MQPLSIELVTSLDKCRVAFWIERVQPISSQEIWPMRWQDPATNQKPGKRNNQKRGDFFYVRVPIIYIVRESSFAFWIFWQTNTMQREHHQALTKNYVLLVNETPVGEILDELVQNKILDHEMRVYLPSSYPEGAYPCPDRNITQERSRSFPCFLLCFVVLEERRFGEGAYQPRHRTRGNGFPGTVDEGAYQPRHRRHGNVFSGTVEFSFGRKPIPDCRTRRNPADWQEYHEWYLLSTSTLGTTADYLGLHRRCCTLFGAQQIYFLRCLVRSRNCLPFASIWVHPRCFGGVHSAHHFSCSVLSYYVSLRSSFRVVMSVTISA